MRPQVIGITGAARTGKDTVAGMLHDELTWCFSYHLAAPIKLGVRAILSRYVDYHKLDDVIANKEVPVEWLGHSPRSLYQELGSAFRNNLDKDFWIKCMLREIDIWENYTAIFDNAKEAGEPVKVIVPDVRYDNEAAAIHNLDGVVIKVIREDAQKVRDHESEAGVADELVNFEIVNDGSLEDLKAKVQGLLPEIETVLSIKQLGEANA